MALTAVPVASGVSVPRGVLPTSAAAQAAGGPEGPATSPSSVPPLASPATSTPLALASGAATPGPPPLDPPAPATPGAPPPPCAAGAPPSERPPGDCPEHITSPRHSATTRPRRRRVAVVMASLLCAVPLRGCSLSRALHLVGRHV